MRLCENVKKYVYNPKFIHNDNNENTRKTSNFARIIKENKNVSFG